MFFMYFARIFESPLARGEQGERCEHVKSAMFTTYPHERKGLVNVVNVAPGYFGSSRTSHAKSIVRNDGSTTQIKPGRRQVSGKEG
jgi:hypothetical protein